MEIINRRVNEQERPIRNINIEETLGTVARFTKIFLKI